MTNRLYYDQTYLREFDATVLEVRREDGRALVRLDQSAFYPTSGGQPYDGGALGGEAVTDVFVDEGGEVWHAVSAQTRLEEGLCVHGVIDWARRFDHMQQHAGEHLLAGMVYRQLGGMTIGLHLGAEDSTIDVTMPDGRVHLTAEELSALEEETNRHIQEDLPIRCWFPSEEELDALPLRKAPTVKEHVRIVAMGEVEMVACGGTHPSSTGQIGLVKLLDARPARGKLRLRFVCGQRAFRDYCQARASAQQAAALLSTGMERLPEAVRSLKEEVASLSREIADLRREQALSRVREMTDQAERLGNDARLTVAQVGSMTMDSLREMASALVAGGGMIALLAADRGDGTASLLFARSEDVSCDLGALMRQSGARGGGRPEFAQGSAAEPERVLQAAREALLSMKEFERQ